jgi:hypothetical protein
MTTARKLKANRVNARASTGPRTVQGKSISAQNACRHGLSLPISSDPALSEEVELLARKIASKGSNEDLYQHARRIAEAQIDLRRIRQKRLQIISEKLDEPYCESRASTRNKLAVVFRFLKPDSGFLTSTPQRVHKLAPILRGQKKELIAIDRYERRALSRRKFAIRDFDAARRQWESNK